MMGDSATTGLEPHVEKWWRWFAVALFLLLPLDLFTTLIAVSKYGTAVEANPIMRSLLERGLVAVTAVNLVVVGVAVFAFHVAIEELRRTPTLYHRVLARVVYGWIAVLLLAGAALVVNNLLVIVQLSGTLLA